MSSGTTAQVAIMRAAVLEEAGGVPAVRTVARPVVGAGEVLVEVSSAALNPHDQVVAAGVRGAPPVPYVVGNEGVGRLPDGTRVYFGPVELPHGSLGEWAVVAADRTVPLPDAISDADALGLGVAGTTAWLSLTWKAGLRPGESVLVMGATGAVGQIAVQGAKLLGARRVVAAGRDPETLERLRALGADDVVRLGPGYEQRLVEVAEDGFDLVVDALFAEPMVAALAVTRHGGRLVNLGMRAGRSVQLSGLAVKGRDLLSYSGDLPPRDVARSAFAAMVEHVLAGDLHVRSRTLPLDSVGEAWERQASGPNAKIVLVL